MCYERNHLCKDGSDASPHIKLGSDLELCMAEAGRYYGRLDHVMPKD